MKNLRALIETLYADYETMSFSALKPSMFRVAQLYFMRMAFRVVVRLRLAQYFRRRGWRLPAILLDHRNWKDGVDICSSAEIGNGIRIAHPHGIVIGGYVKIGHKAYIQQGVTLGGNSGKVRDGDPTWRMPRLGNNVFIGPGAKVLGPLSIGDNAIVGANAVVTKDVQPGDIVVGIPARPIREWDRTRTADRQEDAFPPCR